MMGFGLLIPFLVLVALAYAFGWLPNQDQQSIPQKQKRTTTNALSILEERYARGDINRSEYLEMREDLRR